MGYRLIWEGNVVTKVFDGHVTFDDMLDAMNEVEGHAHFDEVRYAINDFLSVASVDLTEAQVEEIAAIDRAAAISNPQVVVAIVSTNPRILELTKTYAGSPLAPYGVAIFSTLADARRAAGLKAAG
jgi:hypothetical protein